MPNPKGINQYSKGGGGGKRKALPKLAKHGGRAEAFRKAVNKKPETTSAAARRITKTSRRAGR